MGKTLKIQEVQFQPLLFLLAKNQYFLIIAFKILMMEFKNSSIQY